MSFSVSCPCGLEYSGRRPFAQSRRAADPRFLALLGEIGRWLLTAKRSLADLDESTVAAAVPRRAKLLGALPAALSRSADGGALVDGAGPRARVPSRGGDQVLRQSRHARLRPLTRGATSPAAATRTCAALAERLGPRLHLGNGARALRRGPDGVELRTDDGERRAFDAAVVATHADQALGLLEDPSPDESRVLGAFEYTRNEATLHTDARVPAERRGCARFVELPARRRGKPTMTYYLNRLQSLESDVDWCLTLNGDVPDEHVVDRGIFEHPLFTARQPRRAARAAVARGHPSDVVRRRPPRQRIPRGRPRVGCARGRGRSESTGEVGDLRGHADARPPHAGEERLHATRSPTGCSTSTSCLSSTAGWRSSRTAGETSSPSATATTSPADRLRRMRCSSSSTTTRSSVCVVLTQPRVARLRVQPRLVLLVLSAATARSRAWSPS